MSTFYTVSPVFPHRISMSATTAHQGITNENGRGMSFIPRPLLQCTLTCTTTLYLAGRTQEACGPLSPMVSPKTTLSPSARASISMFFKAFSLGGGTYTGIESVTNSVRNMAEPRVRTGKNTMWAIAFSLAFTAGGIILIYLLFLVVLGLPVMVKTIPALKGLLPEAGFNTITRLLGVTSSMSSWHGHTDQ